MFFDDPADFAAWPRKAITIFGMSGVGKTRISHMLREAGWFHYSVDYRIGTRYLGEEIDDNLKREAMKTPFLRDLLMSDSVFIGSNITFGNLAPLASWLGKPGDPARGGIPFQEYARRQELHRAAEIAAQLDTERFIARAHDLYGYDHFICDTSGSLCEVVAPHDPSDRVLTRMFRTSLILYLRAGAGHEEELARRFDKAPKPMYYDPAFLRASWRDYKAGRGVEDDDAVDPDDFIRWGFRALLRRRAPRYEAIARDWGYVVEADDVAALRDADDVISLAQAAIARRLESGG